MSRSTQLAPWVGLVLGAGLASETLALGPLDAGAWSPALQLEYSTVQDTAVAPDGALVAFTVRSTVADEGVLHARRRIWLTRIDGSGARPFTEEQHSSSSPAFSSDGKNLAFLSDRGRERQVWVRSVDGGAPRQITQAPKGVTRFKWAPLANRLAYVAPDPTGHVPRTVDPDSKLPRMGEAFYSHMFVLDLDKPEQRVPEAIRVSWGRFHVDDFSWAPSSRHIALSRRPDPTPDSAFTSSNLIVLNLAGRSLRRGLGLTHLGGTEVGPRWSPDGRWVAYTGSGETPQPIGSGNTYVVSQSGGEPLRLAATPEQAGSSPLGWNADGTAVLVAEAAGAATHVLEVPVDGSAARVVLAGDAYRSAFSQSSDRKTLAFVEERPAAPPEVFVWRQGSSAAIQLTDLHARVPRPAMAATELVQWTSTDGTPIEGLLTRPETRQPRATPLVVVLHGGPAARHRASFTGSPEAYMIQSLAARGWSVLRPNVRGSTGYGREFRELVVGRWGEGDADDVRTGIDEVVRREVASADHVFVVGWGYGGYLSALLTADSDRFRAASVGAPLTDLVSLAATTDIPSYLSAHVGPSVWSDPGPYARKSLLPRVREMETPIQIFHGTEDRRIPLTQSQTLFNGLDERSVPTELVLLPGASGPPSEPDQLLELQRSLHRWLAAHLRAPEPKEPPRRPPPQPRRTSFIRSEYERYGTPGEGIIEGQAFLEMPNGSRRFCEFETVFMNPVTTLSTEWYERNVLDREELEPIPPMGFHWITRSDQRGRFRFVDLPPGDYYLGCRALPEEGFAHGQASVGSGETTFVELVRRIGEEP